MLEAAGKTKKSYKVTNLEGLHQSLVNRGDITFWFNEEVLDAWEHENTEKKADRPFDLTRKTSRSDRRGR